MPQSLSNILVHLVFSTKGRKPTITDDLAEALHRYMNGVLANLDAPSIQVGGMPDHVHILARIPRARSAAEVVETLKTASTRWVRNRGGTFSTFQWQAGYGAFSVSPSNIDRVGAYIRNQQRHHARVGFQEEYRSLLRRHFLNWDERYLWD